MRITHYYSQILRHQSGVTMSLASWARAQQAHGHEVVLASAPAGTEVGETLDALDVRVVRHLGRSRPTYIPTDLARQLSVTDLLVLHEGWMFSNAAAAACAVRSGVPYVVVPHGVYEPGIMAGLKARKVLRERIERAVLEAAAGVHVFFPSEIGLVRDIAPGADCFAVPTGVTGSAGGWRGGGGYVAWIGRYAPEHKGLTRLLDSWATLEPDSRPVLRMHGSDFLGGLARLRAQVGRLGLQRHVLIGDPIYGEAKEEFLRNADMYILPSNWESHSVALVEALERGIPSIVSDLIHIAPLLAAAGAAVISDCSPTALAVALDNARRDRVGLSERALDFVQTSLSWDVAIKNWDAAVTERLGRP